MKIILQLLLLLIVCSSSAFKKSNLKILYAGGSADWSEEYFDGDTMAYQNSVRERMHAFEVMLNHYFESVTVIHAKEYKQEMSEQYDVTVMDGTPVPIAAGGIERDEQGRGVNFIRDGYLTEDFDRPMLLIGELGETLGRRIGLKTDWYCLCLDADAHHFRRGHPIFNGPFPVQMTVKMKPTPEAAFHYTYFSDEPIPDSIPMWKVQTKGYITDTGFRIGMVSRPWGFEDSPDAEYISSGVCAKTLDAIAIGRHGNFFHWGFAASPTYMTQEAQTVLANAIVYISGFNKQGVIARKYSDRNATREYLKEVSYYSTLESYNSFMKLNDESNRVMLERQKEAQEKQKRGEKLNKHEERFLEFKPFQWGTFEDHLKFYQKDLFSLFGMDTLAYHEYYRINRDYFYGGKGAYHLEVDEDVKSLKIPNSDKRIIEEAIKLLETGKDADKGKRILTRYTLKNFSTPGEWRAWYEKYKDLLFFTEAGGWVFLVNTREPGVNDYHARILQDKLASIEMGKTDDNNPVAVAARVITLQDASKEVVLRFKIHPGYHIYANVSEVDPFVPTAITLDCPENYQLSGKLISPAYRVYNQSGTTIYTGEVVFRQKITGAGTGKVKCTIKYQCCDNHICFPPEEKEILININ